MPRDGEKVKIGDVIALLYSPGEAGVNEGINEYEGGENKGRGGGGGERGCCSADHCETHPSRSAEQLRLLAPCQVWRLNMFHDFD